MNDSKCLGGGVCTNPTCPTHGIEWTFDGAPIPVSATVVEDLAAWLTQIWDEEERLAKDAALMSGWDGFGGSRIASGSEWVASYHIVKRKRAEGEPLESRRGRELADCGNMNLERAKHIAAHDPASVLARIAADRKILAEHTRNAGRCDACFTDVWVEYGDPVIQYYESYCRTARLLASPYADRPGFRPEWSVERQGVEW